MAGDEKAAEERRSFLLRLDGPLGAILKIVAVLSLLWAGISYVNPVGEHDLTVFKRSTIPIVIPETEERLSLHFDGKPVRSALLIDCEVFNSGQEPLGSETESP